jgi:ATP-dependent HslUV protease ATP-binding subunit HslU
MQDMLGRFFPQKKRLRKMKVKDAFGALVQDESDKLIDMDKVQDTARERGEQSGIIFLDEIDKIASRQDHGGPDVSREGVQRDLLPVVEGCVVNTQIAWSEPTTSCLSQPSLSLCQAERPHPRTAGAFPLRVELSPLGAEEFHRILTEPQNALTVQYSALLATEGLALSFTDDALRETPPPPAHQRRDGEHRRAQAVHHNGETARRALL